ATRGPTSPRPTAPRRSSTLLAASVTRCWPRSSASTRTPTASAPTAATRSPTAGSTPGPRPPAAWPASPSGPSDGASRGDDPPRPPRSWGAPRPHTPLGPPGLAGRDDELGAERAVGPGRELGPQQLGQAAGVAAQPVR